MPTRNGPNPHSRQKKQSRRAPRRRRPQAESALEVIDRHLLETIPMIVNGRPERVTVLAAIVLKLVQKELAGDAKASRVLLRYQSLVKRRGDTQVELKFIDGDDVAPSGLQPPEDRRG